MSRWSEDLIAVDRARTLDGLFMQRVMRSPDRLAYQYFERDKGWQGLTWREMGDQVARWRQALAGEPLAAGDRVAMLLRNCPEWVMFDQAAFSLGLVTVPLYTDDRAENAAYILQDAAVKVLLIQDAGRWKRLAEVVGDAPWPLRVVILEPGRAASELAAADPRVVVAEQWLPESAPALPQREGNPHELATIVYTSGTTGRSKGVMLSHHNILGNAHAVVTLIDVYPDDVFLSFLPLSHMLERTGGYYLPLMTGSTVAYARSVGQLAEDLQAIRPTVIVAVPRVFERVHQRILDQMQNRPAPVRWLFRLAVKTGWRAFLREQGRAGWHPLLLFWPWLRRKVAGQVLSRLGGRIRVAVSGGAALPTGVAQTFIGLGLPLIQGYGLTETSPVVSFNPLHANIPESVGVPIRGIQVRIGADDELLVKGENVMQGYWNNHAATTKILTQDGWLHTGDQARMEGRHIFITGRLKDILVLSNGEKVPPADLEMAISMDPLFDQVVVLGEGHSYLTALLVLNADLWGGLAREYGLDPGQSASLDDPHLHKDVLKRIRLALHGFPGYAKIRRVTLTLEPWSIESGLLTPTMKVKRAAVMERYQEAIDGMYRMDG
ncbi:AMP-dependent synthetase/ligase [Thiobaca trueperi]|uniref:Long-chain acyl-CoA synthetase n=1 Tax=Thiobaca trueperi TaxID=127458 RepID=A0A4R3N396_9GAMM|nr:long-chain fatty acid--CoA ligase [Thiobaca trueperi]TCT21543.1 long-chain acyl-CoA synthetase [Thiobaca trueperi]